MKHKGNEEEAVEHGDFEQAILIIYLHFYNIPNV